MRHLLANLTNSEKRVGVLPTIIFKDDWVKVMRRILNGQKSQIVTQLEQFYFEQPLLPNHQRLIRWLMDLAKKGNKPTSTLSIKKERE